MYQFFFQLGFAIKIHPELQNSSKTPDFFLKRGDIEFYAEAKLVNGVSDLERVEENRLNEVYNNINKMRLEGFYLTIDEIKLKSLNQPSSRNIIKRIEIEVKKYDPRTITKIVEKDYNLSPIIDYEDENIFVSFKLMPAPNKPKDSSVAIGSYQGNLFVGGGEENLKNAVYKKVNKYGKLEKPYVICINNLNKKSYGKEDVDNAVWGSLAVSWSDNPNHRDEKLIRKRDGLFTKNNGRQLKNVSALLVTKVHSGNMSFTDYWIYAHPDPTHNLELNSIGLRYDYLVNNQIESANGKKMTEIFKIDES
jgi:hypothetical protein